MQTPAAHAKVLVGSAALIGLGLLFVARWMREGERSLAAVPPAAAWKPLAPTTDDPAAPVLTAAEPAEHGRRKWIERPLDETRCGECQLEATFTTVLQDGAGNRVPDALVAVFELDGDRPRTDAAFPTVHVQADGRACLRTSRAGDVVMAVFAPGYRPSARRVRAEVGARVDLEPFVLEPGAAIEGRVRAGGEPLARAEVEALACPECEVFRVAGTDYAWRGGRFVRARCSVESAADGSYRLAGLDTGAHVVRLSALRRREFALDVSKAAPLHEIAPSTGADFELPAARLELQFRSESEPLCCVDVQIEADGRHFARTADETGRLALWVQPSLAYPLIATRRGFLTKRDQLRGLVDGERFTTTIDLDVQHVLASVILRDDPALGGDEATVSFRPRFPLMHGSEFERTLKRDPNLGTFVVPDVPTGAWRVIFHSGRVQLGHSTMRPDEIASARELCDVEALVDVPESGTLRVDVLPRRAPAVRVVARDDHGEPVDFGVKLFDGSGDEIDGVWSSPSAPPQSGASRICTSDNAVLVRSTVCAGQIEIAVFAEGFRTVRVPVSSGEAEPKIVDVILNTR